MHAEDAPTEMAQRKGWLSCKSSYGKRGTVITIEQASIDGMV